MLICISIEAVVPELYFRHGHRLHEVNGGRGLQCKVTNRLRKHRLTLGLVHLDSQEALDNLVNVSHTSSSTNESTLAASEHQGLSDAPLDTQEIEDAQTPETDALRDIADIIIEDDDNP